MLRGTSIRVGVLFAILPWFVLSCGSTTPTEPLSSTGVVSVAAPERFLTSSQGEARELLIDGRATGIEWNISGPPTYVQLRGDEGGGGGNFMVAVRSLWSYANATREPKAFYLLLQWPDISVDRLDRPVVNDSVDIFDDNGQQIYDCLAGDDGLVRPTSWHRSPIEEDQVVVEIFSDSLGSYPADNWRWGAGTTDPVFPSSSVEFQGAVSDGDTLGQTKHPAAGFMDDRWDMGGGPVDDVGLKCYHDNFTVFPNGIVPDSIASKGTRDTRLNRGKPTAYVIWGYVATRLTACDILNPVRVDDSGVRDKTWNPGDYVPSHVLRFPTDSQLDVLARATWDSGKWGLEIRRELETFYRPPNSTQISEWIPWSDDLKLEPGRRYMMRITVYDASSTRGSRSALIPLYLKPRS
jgi:hypothetical protein